MTDAPDYRREFSCRVLPGARLEPLESGRWIGWLTKHIGKVVNVHISREKILRSNAQNARYWSLIVPCFSEWSGYEKDEAHEVLLGLFSSYEDRLPSGEVVMRVLRSSKMDMAQFNAYTERVERFLVGQGFEFPEKEVA